ncbi:MAG: hypothetical protein NTV49_05580 [Kiritimatiellaeota bacterium]|nr:hypothetical protein [Kiritimatiellota bacterium]
MRAGVLLAALLIASQAFAQSPTKPELQLAVDLTDGSHLIGTSSVRSLQVQTEYTTLDLPLNKTDSLTKEAKAPTVVLVLQNGDKLTGMLLIKSIDLSGTFGKVSILIEHIVKMTVAENSATRAKFDVAEDFSIKDNPAGPWSYGWIEKPDGSFHLFTNTHISSACPDLRGWKQNESFGVIINTSEEIIHASGSTFRPKQVAVHPGSSGGCAIVRWTAMRAGTVKLAGAFTGLSGLEGTSLTTTDVHVLHQGEEVFASDLNLHGKGNESPFDVRVAVQPGDTIDFSVGYGNGSHNCDTTGLEVVVEYTP